MQGAAHWLGGTSCLLDVGSQLGEGLGVGQDGSGRVAQEADVPDRGQPQLHWDVLLKGRIPEVLVHIPCTCTHACLLSTALWYSKSAQQVRL